MKAENYLTISGWMYNLAGGSLSLPEILTYAVIYGFSQDGETRFTGSRSYLADLLRCSKNSVSNYLQSLEKKGLIVKEVQTVNGVDFNRYRAVLPGVSVLPEEPAAPATAGNEAPAAPAPAAPATPARRACKAFIPPTREEVRAYAREKGLAVDPDRFFDFFTADEEHPWVDSKGNKVVSWKQKMLTWSQHDAVGYHSMQPARPQRVMRSIDEL